MKSSEEPRPVEGLPELVVRNRKEFLANYDPSFPYGGIFCPTRRKLVEGEPVVVRVRLGRRQPPVLIHGRVAWRRAGRHTQKIRAGLGIEFFREERSKSSFVLDLARAGEAVRSRRRHERLPVEVPVSWRMSDGGAGARGVLSDIGRGGAFVRSTEPAPHDADVVLEVEPPGAQVAMAFAARVTWIVPAGANAGFGVKWRARDAGGGKRIRELVRRLTGTHAVAP
jgi:Tfp pilus assembly protein PilZ